MDEFRMKPVAYVENERKNLDDDHWGEVVSKITLIPSLSEECLFGLEDFSHAEIIFCFNQTPATDDIPLLRHPRGNPTWPKVGIFSQRNKDRPNYIGLTIARILRRDGNALFVKGLDAIHGTPVLDIKPVMSAFLPRGEVHQPFWAYELTQNYWGTTNDNP